MRVTPKTEKEIAEMGLIPAGTYDFEVKNAEDQVSKASGNDMIKLTLTVFDDGGQSHIVFDYLLDAMPAKLRHAAEVFGMLGKYERGALISDEMIGRTGKVKIGIQKGKDNFPDRNAVLDYVISSAPNQPASRLAPRPSEKATGVSPLDDDIPFAPEWR